MATGPLWLLTKPSSWPSAYDVQYASHVLYGRAGTWHGLGMGKDRTALPGPGGGMADDTGHGFTAVGWPRLSRVSPSPRPCCMPSTLS